MAVPTYTTTGIVAGQPENAAEVKTALDQIYTILNGGIDTTNVSSVHYDDITTDSAGLAAGAFRVYRKTTGTGGSAQSIPASTTTAIDWDTKDFDFSTWFDLTTDRFTPQAKAVYRLKISAMILTVSDQKRVIVEVRRNGVTAAQGFAFNSYSGGGSLPATVDVLVQANGTTDYFTAHVYHEEAAAHDLNNDPITTWFEGHMIGRTT